MHRVQHARHRIDRPFSKAFHIVSRIDASASSVSRDTDRFLPRHQRTNVARVSPPASVPAASHSVVDGVPHEWISGCEIVDWRDRARPCLRAGSPLLAEAAREVTRHTRYFWKASHRLHACFTLHAEDRLRLGRAIPPLRSVAPASCAPMVRRSIQTFLPSKLARSVTMVEPVVRS